MRGVIDFAQEDKERGIGGSERKAVRRAILAGRFCPERLACPISFYRSTRMGFPPSPASNTKCFLQVLGFSLFLLGFAGSFILKTIRPAKHSPIHILDILKTGVLEFQAASIRTQSGDTMDGDFFS
jgi:hypothetical protein